MKRASQLIDKVADIDNLYLAAWKAAKGKRHSQQVLAYNQDLYANISLLQKQIVDGRVEVGAYHYFKIFEPKERQICASAFSEQVLHHALMNICHPYFDRTLIDQCYASRENKGIHAALEQAKTYSKNYKWYLKLDVKKFFDSINHEVLKQQLKRLIKDYAVVAIFNQIVDSYAASPKRGLPIGNLTSQYFANHYLSSLDHFIKEDLKIPAYVRYMDDLVLWHQDKDVLKLAHITIGNYVQNALKCSLKPEMLNQTQVGLPFLGYHIFPFHTRLLQKSKQRFIRKINGIHEKYHDGNWSEAKCQRHALPLLAFISHADSHNFQKSVILRLKG